MASTLKVVAYSEVCPVGLNKSQDLQCASTGTKTYFRCHVDTLQWYNFHEIHVSRKSHDFILLQSLATSAGSLVHDKGKVVQCAQGMCSRELYLTQSFICLPTVANNETTFVLYW